MNIPLGKIVGVFGVKGWVKVFSETRPREQIYSYSPWNLNLNGSESVIKVLDGRVQGKGLVAHLEGVNNCDDAAKYVGAEISITQDAMPATDIGEYYWSELTGLAVFNTDGVEMGQVTGLFETGANDVMVVKRNKDADQEAVVKEHLIPFTEFAVIEVNLDEKKIIVDWDPDF